MNFQSIIFYAFAAMLIFSALRVITARNPVHAAMFLVLSFFTAAALWLLIYAEFLAITLILVYVGAVMVLFLFVVMMLDINFDKLREGFWKHLPIAATVAALMAAQMALLLWGSALKLHTASPGAPAATVSNTKALGRLLYSEYLLPFELAAVVLLVAMVAAIALTFRGRKDVKSQNIAAQVRVKSTDRLKIISMRAEVEPPVEPKNEEKQA
jgi:NADH-quinone oxidoreductase subunit J